MQPSTDRPPSGWYPDPGGRSGALRWWDGTRWGTELRLPLAAPPRYGPTGFRPSIGSGQDPRWEQIAAARRQAPSWQQIVDQGLPTPRRIPARAVWWAVLGFVIGELLGGALSAAVAVAAGTPAARVTNNPVVTLFGEIGLWTGLIGACVVVSRRYGSGSLRADFRLRVRPVDLAIGVLVACAALAIDVVVADVFVHTRFHGSNTQLLTGQRHNSVGFVIVTLIAALGAPFFEELFFRGLLRTALQARIGSLGAIWVQAGLFGLAHFQANLGWGNVSVVVAIAGVGLVLGYTADRTGRLGAGMVGHGLFNLVVAILTLVT